MKLKVWTKAYRPFLMGGNVNAPVSTVVEVGEPVEADNDIKLHEIKSPQGTTHVVESTTGAFVGTDIEQVKKDIKNADPEVIQDQLENAKRELEACDALDSEAFWKLFL